jgi:hypothetical protein
MKSDIEKLREALIVIREIKAMRNLQKAYFKSRYDDPSKSGDLLNQSKLQEKKVDQMLNEFL